MGCVEAVALGEFEESAEAKAEARHANEEGPKWKREKERREARRPLLKRWRG